MSSASSRGDAGAKPWTERLQPWIAALVSTLVQVLMLLLLMLASTPIVTAPQGAGGGSRMKVDVLGETRQVEQPAKTPPSPAPQKPKRPRKPATSPVRSTLVRHSDDPVPDETDTHTTAPAVPTPQSQLPEAWDLAAQRPARTPSSSPPAAAERRPETWTGRPPGMLDEDVADADEGMADSAAVNRGNGRNPDASGPGLGVGGYMVYYDLRSETQLRAWIAQGMKELFIPLPGTRDYMVCEAEIALRRGSGKCRLLHPDSPELKDIGDAREVINMMDVYHRGERVWHGPGPYR